MKTEVYSWRVSGELKSDLERRARERKQPVSSILEEAARDWLEKHDGVQSDEEEQRRLHNAVAPYIGAISMDKPYSAEAVREAVRKRVKQRYAR